MEPAELLSALRMGEAKATELSGEWQEKAQQTLQAARGRLKAAAAARNWRQAQKELEAQLEAEEDADPVGFQAALEALTEAHSQLMAEGAELKALGFEAELRVKGQMQLVLLNATKKKEEALRSLRSSLMARQAEPDKVLPALVAAKAAGLDRQLAAMRLAEAVTRPQELCRSLLSDAAAAPAPHDDGFSLVVEDFGSAAKVVAADLDSSELLGECARLAEALASMTEQQLEDGRQTLQQSLEQLRQRSYARAVKDFQSAYEGRMALWQRQQQRAREESAKYVRDLTSEAQRRFATEREAKLEDLRQDLGIALASICQEDAQETQKRLGMMQGPLETLEAARRESTHQGKVSLSAKLLGAAEEPQEALRSLQGEPSGFVATLLKDLQVEDAALNALEIRRSFSSLLVQLAAVALAPPAESLLGRLVSRSLGQTLAKLYEVSSFPAPPEGDTVSPRAAGDVERNLATLTLAAKRLEVNDFVGAVTALEGLTGECQRRAGGWLRSARQSLLWQQTIEALQAKARCLNAA